MDDTVAVAAANDGDVVDALRRLRKQVGNRNSGFPVPAKGPFRTKQLGTGFDLLVFDVAERFRPVLSVEPVEQRLGVERFDVTRAAGHKEENDRSGLGRVRMRGRCGERIAGGCFEPLFPEHRRQRQRSDSATGRLQKPAAGSQA